MEPLKVAQTLVCSSINPIWEVLDPLNFSMKNIIGFNYSIHNYKSIHILSFSQILVFSPWKDLLKVKRKKTSNKQYKIKMPNNRAKICCIVSSVVTSLRNIFFCLYCKCVYMFALLSMCTIRNHLKICTLHTNNA